jgi:hypothetical protein
MATLGSIPHLELDASQWRLVGEGNTKIVFAPAAEFDCTESPHYAKVLIVPKGKKGNGDISPREGYLRNVVEKFISAKYLPDHLVYAVESRQVAAFLASCGRDLLVGDANEMETCLVATESDLSHLSYIAKFQGNNNTCRISAGPRSAPEVCKYFSVELKPKCGLRAISPFVVDETNPIKKQIGRYQLMQYSKYYELHHTGKQPRWGRLQNVSLYEPLDVMSNDFGRVQRAVLSLTSNPQNNLGIRANGKLLFGWNAEDPFPAQFISEAFGIFHDPIDSAVVQMNFADLLANILLSESLLGEIKLLQSLDILDVEGCNEIFARLVYLTGSVEQALRQLDQSVSEDFDLSAISTLNSIVAFHERPDTMQTPQQYDRQVTKPDTRGDILFGQLLRFSVEKATKPALLEWVGNLVVEDCLFLLRSWLIALSAKDMSIIIAISICRREDVDSVSADYDRISRENIEYSMGLIDYGPKPVEKLLKKIKEEPKICEQARMGKELFDSCSMV